MPLNTKIPRQPGASDFLDALHKSFLDARRGMHLATKAVGTAEWRVKHNTLLRDRAQKLYDVLFALAIKGELTASLFKELNDAEDALKASQDTLDNSKAAAEAARSREQPKVAACQRARVNCVSSKCPETHFLWVHRPHEDEEGGQYEDCNEKYKTKEGRYYEQYFTEGPGASHPSPSGKAGFEHFPWHWYTRKGEYKTWVPPSTKQPGENGSSGQREGAMKTSAGGSPKPSPFSQTNFTQKPTAKPFKSASDLWLERVHEAFKDYASMSSFPSPPATGCKRTSCVTQTRALAACCCDIRRVLMALSTEQLKQLRFSFHPDKFSKCRPESVKLFGKQAAEVFVVVEAVYREKKR